MFSKNQLLFLSLFLFFENTQCACLMNRVFKTASKAIGKQQVKTKAVDYCLSGEEQSELKEHLDVPADSNLPIFTHVLEDRVEYVNDKLIVGKKVQKDLKSGANTRQTRSAKIHAHQHVSDFKKGQERGCLGTEIATIVAIEHQNRHAPRTLRNTIRLGALSFATATGISRSVALITNEVYKAYHGLDE